LYLDRTCAGVWKRIQLLALWNTRSWAHLSATSERGAGGGGRHCLSETVKDAAEGCKPGLVRPNWQTRRAENQSGRKAAAVTDALTLQQNVAPTWPDSGGHPRGLPTLDPSPGLLHPDDFIMDKAAYVLANLMLDAAGACTGLCKVPPPPSHPSPDMCICQRVLHALVTPPPPLLGFFG